MKKVSLLLIMSSCFLLINCMSLVKADHLVYAGSFGKKVDAVLIDSLSRVDINKQE